MLKSFPKNFLMITTVLKCIEISSSRLQKEHNKSCGIPNRYSILFRNKILLSNLYWKTRIVVFTVAIRGRKIVFQFKLEISFFKVSLRRKVFMFDYSLHLVQFTTVKFGKANHLVFLDEVMVLNEKILKTSIMHWNKFFPFSW